MNLDKEKLYYTIKEIVGDKKAKPPIPALFPVGRTTWYAGINSGIYPRPVYLGARKSAWRREDLEKLFKGHVVPTSERRTLHVLSEKPKIKPKANPIIKSPYKPINRLTESELNSLPRRIRPYRVQDGAGLYLEIRPKGKFGWRIKYQFNKKERRASLGVWPDVSVAEARNLRDAWHQDVLQNVDPLLKRQTLHNTRRLEHELQTQFVKLQQRLFKEFKHLTTIDPNNLDKRIEYASHLAGCKEAHQEIFRFLFDEFVQKKYFN